LKNEGDESNNVEHEGTESKSSVVEGSYLMDLARRYLKSGVSLR